MELENVQASRSRQFVAIDLAPATTIHRCCSKGSEDFTPFEVSALDSSLMEDLAQTPLPMSRIETVFLFDLDGTLVDSVYQHVLAWREALDHEGIDLSVWRIHRRI